MIRDIDEILNDQKHKITDIYFELQEAYQSKFGNDVVILYELGTFYEVYQYNDLGKAIEVSHLINAVLTRKNKKIDISKTNPHMCGIPSIKIDKYLDILLREEKYTIIIVSQIGEGKNVTRKIDKVISPGTNIDFNDSFKNNYISSIYLEKLKSGIIIGSSAYVDITSGNVFTFEIYGKEEDKEFALDELYKLSLTYEGKEVLIITDGFEQDEYIYIKNKLDLDSKVFVIHDKEYYKKSLNINYQDKLLSSIYNIKSMLSTIEYFDMEMFTNMSSALTLLIEFIIDHNHSVINNLKEPIILNNNKFLHLGNNAAEQLEIIGSNQYKGLVEILTKGCTPFGKRFINQRIINPIIDPNEINRRYNNSKQFIDSSILPSIKENLSKMYDMERLNRKILIESIHPFELSNFYTSLNHFMKIYKLIFTDNNLKNLDILSKINIKELIKIYKDIENFFDIDLLSMYSINSIDKSFIKFNINESIDSLKKEYDLIYRQIFAIASTFSKLIDNTKEYDENSTLVKLNHNETEGFFLSITKNRYDSIKDKLSSINLKLDDKIINLEKDFVARNLRNTIKITNSTLKNVSEKLNTIQSEILKETIIFYKNFINSLNIHKETLDNLTLFLGELEFSILNATLYSKNSYCIPTILDLEDDSFYQASKLRHPIIERIESNGIYVPNDIVLGNKKHMLNNPKFDSFYSQNKTDELLGIMLYGLNAAGKSSTMKSVGISIVLAQAGMFVPAESLRFTLYDSIFTRISGKDNIYKGLSSFAVEMTELKNIFNRVDGKSLVLGDEISHGTETISGMSIVASTVINLVENNNHFIFATHLHQLNDLDEIKELNKMVHLHLDVKYDDVNDKLIYNRELQYGHGASVYGLEFAKYLKLDKKFLLKANEIRKKIAEDLDNIEIISQKKTSRYNSKVFFTKCALCNKKADDIHHIKEQHTANENGLIDHHRKNHKYNLVPLCREHHNIIHDFMESNPNEILLEYKQTSNGIELQINPLIIDKL